MATPWSASMVKGSTVIVVSNEAPSAGAIEISVETESFASQREFLSELKRLVQRIEMNSEPSELL